MINEMAMELDDIRAIVFGRDTDTVKVEKIQDLIMKRINQNLKGA